MDPQLGAKIGDIRVGCILMSSQSKWCRQSDPDQTDLHGLLYFTFDFHEYGQARLMSATVATVFTDPSLKGRVAVVSCAPSNALKPANAPTHQISESSAIEIKPRVDINGIGAELGSYSNANNSGHSVKQDWAFRSSKLAVSAAEYSWRRESPDDKSGLDRTYHAALVLRRKRHENVTLEVRVHIPTRKYIGTSNGKIRRVCIGLDTGESVSKADFDKLAHPHNLQKEILDRNRNSAPKCKMVNVICCLS
jgi:hypothetical protein